jgi:hypothetical protein
VALSVLGLLLATRYLALHGASREQLRPARRLLVFSSGMTLALNVVDPLIAGHVGKAAFDAVGPLLLIGWAEVGPGLLQAISGIPTGKGDEPAVTVERDHMNATEAITQHKDADNNPATHERPDGAYRREPQPAGDDLLERARQEDARHWEAYQRPISAETLRKRLRVGAARSRMLVAMVRSTSTDRAVIEASEGPRSFRTGTQ